MAGAVGVHWLRGPPRSAYAFTFIAGPTSQTSEDLCRINHGCPTTKNWSLSSDTSIPELRSRRHGNHAPTLSHGLPGTCRNARSTWASCGRSIWPSSLNKKKRSAATTRQKKQDKNKHLVKCVCMRDQFVEEQCHFSESTQSQQRR